MPGKVEWACCHHYPCFSFDYFQFGYTVLLCGAHHVLPYGGRSLFLCATPIRCALGCSCLLFEGLGGDVLGLTTSWCCGLCLRFKAEHAQDEEEKKRKIGSCCWVRARPERPYSLDNRGPPPLAMQDHFVRITLTACFVPLLLTRSLCVWL
jgi:hypothetical protein